MADWQTLSSRIAYENPFMRVHEDTAINPVGKETIYAYTESTEASAYIVPVDDDGYIYLIRQYRYPHQKSYWEVAAGRIPHDEDITEGARRELLEETGFEAKEMINLGEMLSTPGITNFASTIFLAHGLKKVSDELDVADGITDLKKVRFDDIGELIAAGELQCSTSIAACYMVKEYLQKEHQNR